MITNIYFLMAVIFVSNDKNRYVRFFGSVLNIKFFDFDLHLISKLKINQSVNFCRVNFDLLRVQP